jgi:hypothetical protein
MTRNGWTLLFAFSLNACGYGSHHDDHDAPPAYAGECGRIQQATIDTGAGLEAEPGLGAGAFVEYAEGGIWRIFTACDTASTGFGCAWDIIVSTIEVSALLASAPEDLESDDLLLFESSQSLRLIAYTDRDFDGFSFEAEPGLGVRVDALLDNGCSAGYVFWRGDGANHVSPSNPLDLIPSAP